ncbi:hypothetical protein pb186bvf_015341 [Paramecium bursaria]
MISFTAKSYDALENLKSTKGSSQTLSLLLNQQTSMGQRTIYKQDDCNYRLYNGHFAQWHEEKIEYDEDNIIGGIESEFCYLINERDIIFHTYPPNNEDLNFYYNTDPIEFRFPIAQDVQTLKQEIQSVAFSKQANYWLMAVAFQFEINFHTILIRDGVMQFTEIQDHKINLNGEQIHQMVFYNLQLIFGGDSGYLSRHSLEESQLKQKGTNYYIKVKKAFQDLVYKRKHQKLVQIEIDKERGICFGLFENYESNQLKVKSTYIVIYDMGFCQDKFELVGLIRQDELFNLNNIFSVRRDKIPLEDLQMFHIKVLDLQFNQLPSIQIITSKQIILNLQFECEEQDLSALTERFNLQQIMDKQLKMEQIKNEIGGNCYFYRIKLRFQITNIQNPIIASHDLMQHKQDFSVFMDNSSRRVELKEVQPSQDSGLLQAAFSDYHVTLFISEDQLTARFHDYQFQSHLATQGKIYDKKSMFGSVFNDYSDEAIEVIGKIQSQGNQVLIGKQDIHQIFNITSQEITQLYNIPKHFIVLTKKQINFYMFFRPVDFIFTALKVSSRDMILRPNNEYPLEKLFQLYTLEESSVLLLQIVIQREGLFFINVDLYDSFCHQIDELLAKVEPFKINSKPQNHPAWVVGKVYVLKGEAIYDKALKAYLALIQRDYQGQDRVYSTLKIHSITQLLRRIISPISDKPLINKQSFDMKTNQQLKSFTKEQIQAVQQQIKNFLYLFNNTQEFYLRNRREEIKQQKDTNQSPYDQGFLRKELYPQEIRQRNLNNNYVNVNSELEYNKLGEIYKKLNQIDQFLEFINFFTEEQNYVRDIINSIEDQQFMFNFRIQHLIESDLRCSTIIKQLIVKILKKEKDNLRVKATEMHQKYSEFFNQQDYRLALSIGSFDEILLFAYKENIIKLDVSEGLNIKLKRLFRLTTSKSITVEQILKTTKVLKYYKELVPKLQDEILEALNTMQDNAVSVSSVFLNQTIRPYMFPFGTFYHYFRILQLRYHHIEKQIDKKEELNQQVLYINDEINNLLDTVHSLGLKRMQADEIIQDSLKEIALIKNEQIHQNISQLLIEKNLQGLIVLLDPKYNITQNLDEIQIMIGEFKRLNEKFIEGQSIQIFDQLCDLGLKIAQYSFQKQPQLGYYDITKSLPIQTRILYAQKVYELLDKCQLEYVKDKNKRSIFITELIYKLELQEVLYDYVDKFFADINKKKIQQKYIGNEENERRKMLISEVLEMSKIYQFFQENNCIYGQIIYQYYQELFKIKTNSIDVEEMEELYSRLIQQYKDSNQFPNKSLFDQLDIIFSKVKTANIYQKESMLKSIILAYEYLHLMQINAKRYSKQNYIFQFLIKYYPEKLVVDEYLKVLEISVRDESIESQTHIFLSILQLWSDLKQTNKLDQDLIRRLRVILSSIEIIQRNYQDIRVIDQIQQLVRKVS